MKAARPRWKGTDVQESLCPLLWNVWLVIRKRRALLAHLVFERLSSSLEHAIKTEEDEKKRGQSRPARNEPRRHRAELKLPRKSTGSRKTGLGWKVGVPSYWSTFALPGISLSPAKKDAIFKSWVRIKGCQKILLTPSRLCFINWDYCSIFSFIACQLLTRVGQSEVGSQELFELSFRSTPAC